MIKTSSDFENSINFLSNDISEDLYQNIKYQNKSLDSESFNTTFNLIEDKLNTLYEKTRVMEDLIVYTRTFLEQEIYTAKKEFQAILNSLEDKKDSLKAKAYISYDVPFLESSGAYVDRDGKELAHAAVNNGFLTLSGQTQYEVQLKNIERITTMVPYKSNPEAILKGQVYRSFYIVDKPVQMIYEEITAYLNSPTLINYLELIPSNCKVVNLRYISENDLVIDETNFSTGMVRDIKIKAIKFDIACDKYKKIAYQIDESRVLSDFWTKVKDKAYNDSMGISTVFDIDEYSGMKKYKSDYASYLKSIENWYKIRDAYYKNS